MRFVLAGFLIAGMAYLYFHQKHKDAQLPPPPAPADLPATPILSMEDIERVRRSAGDLDPNVRWAAIQLLVTVKDPEIVAVVDKIMRQDTEPELRAKAVELLQKVENVTVLPPLIRGLQDPEQNVRISSLRSMGAIGDPAAVPWITESLKDYEPQVRAEALRTLSLFQDKRRREWEALAQRLRAEYQEAVKRSQASPFDIKPIGK